MNRQTTKELWRRSQLVFEHFNEAKRARRALKPEGIIMLRWLDALSQQEVYEVATLVLVAALIFLLIRKQPHEAFIVFLAVAFFVWINRPSLDDETTTLQAGVTGLRVTIGQAQATIHQMQQLAGLLGETVINIDRYSGMLGGVPATVQKEHRAKVSSILTAISAGADAVSEVTRAGHDQDADAEFANAFSAGEDSFSGDEKKKSDFVNAYNAAYNQDIDQDGLFPPEALRKLFQQFNVTSPSALKALNDYSDFYSDPTKVQN